MARRGKRNHTPAFKAKVALAAMKGEKLETEAASALQQGSEVLVALGAREGFSFSQEELAVGL